MNMINTSTVDPLVFLDGTPEASDKIHWKRAYATYLLITNKTPEDCATKKIPLVALRQILAKDDHRWSAIDDEMMKTTYNMVQRLNMFLIRFRAKIIPVKVIMQGILEQ